MIVLYDETILNDFINKSIDNFFGISAIVSTLLFIIISIICIVFVSIYMKKKNKLSSKKNISKVGIIFGIFIIFHIINIINVFVIKFGYGYYLNTHQNEINWNISLETISKKEDIYIGGRRSSYNQMSYYLYFNQETESKFDNTNKIKVEEDLFNKVKDGDKMYVIRDKNNKIILVYNAKEYKYVNDEKIVAD